MTDGDLPARIGPVRLERLGGMIAVRCPSDFEPLMRKAGGMWDSGDRRRLIHQRRINPLIRELRRTTDPLFRRVGIDLDGEATQA